MEMNIDKSKETAAEAEISKDLKTWNSKNPFVSIFESKQLPFFLLKFEDNFPGYLGKY